MSQKVLVTRRQIAELKQRAAQLEKDTSDRHTSLGSASRERPPENTPDNYHTPPDGENLECGLVNPLVFGPPAFMSPGNGRTYYLGTSSNWSFARRVLSMVHEHVHKGCLPTEVLVFEGTAYDLGWDGSRTDPSSESPLIPTLDHAIYLINAVKFRCGQLYHLFDDSDFMESLYSFYSEDQQTRTKGLWYIHFLIILAFGKMFTQVKYLKGKPLGISLFVKALQILPDHTLLYSSPIVGQAMRMAMAHGMHTCMPVMDLGRDSVERCRKIWWTVYILDRHMTSIQGLPQSVDDHFIQTKLPSPVGSENITILDMHIKLCRSIADINAKTFLTFDLESVFISTVVLLMAPAIDRQLVANDTWWHATADLIFNDMVEAGNQIARFRHSEIQQLDEKLNLLMPRQDQNGHFNFELPLHSITKQPLSSHEAHTATPIAENSCSDPFLGGDFTLTAGCAFEPSLTSAEMMAMVNSIELFDAEWASTMMDNHAIW
ncbi:fungal-specific transcription factor domain-containing protein [Aspergillus eucalypticola CBS 122712]|uniref:Fungal-specific transcription factor domain-containing protein n=1 Tax=Aspergillus eucalypticola (strain CBS 122712 / IBT 29274) TaxID=1448314 RepID=A0A317VHU7_ASPEC|nr:fungal-specific transcription factor domain-containing protein [Aspergillus eucalypticola CBS 122712]PWY72751.1 fungal-specific transcription factor domain-containing protein [Aspergillus eucalypticola CBS 122712]